MSGDNTLLMLRTHYRVVYESDCKCYATLEHGSWLNTNIEMCVTCGLGIMSYMSIYDRL